MKKPKKGKPCPHCSGKYRAEIWGEAVQRLYKEKGLNARSRRTGELICRLCGMAEGLADSHPALTDAMARIAIQNDFDDAIRVPGFRTALGVMAAPWELVDAVSED